MTVALDSLFAARQLSDAAREVQREIAVLAEVDLGLGRVGVLPGAPCWSWRMGLPGCPGCALKALLSILATSSCWMRKDAKALDQLSSALSGVLRDLRQAGLTAKIVSGGSTPTLWNSHEIAGLNRDPPGHLHLQRPQHVLKRGMHAPGLRRFHPDHDSLDREERPGDNRRRLKDLLLGPASGRKRSQLRARGGGAAGRVQQDE